jgi:hypothetical protein
MMLSSGCHYRVDDVIQLMLLSVDDIAQMILFS